MEFVLFILGDSDGLVEGEFVAADMFPMCTSACISIEVNCFLFPVFFYWCFLEVRIALLA